MEGGGSGTGRLGEEIKLVDCDRKKMSLSVGLMRCNSDFFLNVIHAGCRGDALKMKALRALQGCQSEASPIGLIGAGTPAVMTDVTFPFPSP